MTTADNVLRDAADATALTCPAADTEWSGLRGCDVSDKFGNLICTARTSATARFIALADPPTVLSLLDRLDNVAPGVWWCPSFEQVTALDSCSACGPVVAPHRRLLIEGTK